MQPWAPFVSRHCLLQNWVKDMSAYVKSIDPAHLVMVSSWGYFGRSTPELQPQNPFDLTWRGIGNNAGVRKADFLWLCLACAAMHSQ